MSIIVIDDKPKGFHEMLGKVLLLCLSFGCIAVSSGMSTRDIAAGWTGLPAHLWWTTRVVTVDASKKIYIREVSWVGIQFFLFAHNNGFWRHNLGWVCFSLITWLPQPKVGTGTRVLRELKRQMSSHFWEDVKGYSRRDMTFPLERMKNKLNFLSATFMNHSFPFVCGDRFLYFPEENTFFLEEVEAKEKVNQNVLVLSFLSRTTTEASWWIHPYGYPFPGDSYLQMYLQGGIKFPRPPERKGTH